ncbi:MULTISPECIES: hypothetical protein [unclassified Streptomyces]|uniref:hypothetical protein n=1 Tax=unclassified Streptomyces TaxID=2593676 RepID=UPI0036EDC6A2
MPYPPVLAGDLITASLLTSLMPLEALKTADESRASSATMANDAELSIPVVANAKYQVQGYLIYSQNLAASATTGIKIGWSAPTGASLLWTSGGTDGPTSLTGQDVTSQTIAATRSLPSNLGTFMTGIPFGTLTTVGAAGTFTLQWAQVASNATPTIVRASSWIRLRRVA